MKRRCVQEFDYGNGYCNTLMACRIIAEIRNYHGDYSLLDSTLRNAMKKGKIKSMLIGRSRAWEIESVKKLSEEFVSIHGDASKNPIRVCNNLYNSTEMQQLLSEIRNIAREEIAAAFK